MLRDQKIAEDLGPVLTDIEETVTKLYRQGKYPNEDWVSGSLVTQFLKLRGTYGSGKRRADIIVDAHGVKDEPKSGADIGIRYQFETPEFSVSRGIIVQAKRYNTQHPDLPLQCLKMLQRTEESYIFTYSDSMIGVFPSLPILLDEGQGSKFTKYYCQPFTLFMRRFIQGFYGEIPLAKSIDQPSDVKMVEERVKFLVDIKTHVYESEDIQEPSFDHVEHSAYHTLSIEDYYPENQY